MEMCLRVLKESNKSRFDRYSRQKQCRGSAFQSGSGSTFYTYRPIFNTIDLIERKKKTLKTLFFNLLRLSYAY